MIKRAIKRLLGVVLPRFRLPVRPGVIEVFDDVSGATLKLHWREDSMMETQLFRYGLYGAWERHSLRLWAHMSKSASEILDVGANTGIYSLLARKNNPRATIAAIEPIELNANVLDANIRANNAAIKVDRVAMSDTSGQATMYMLEDQLNYMTSVNDDRYARHPEVAGDARVVRVAVAIDTWHGVRGRLGLQGPDLIKIDVEGHEVAVLRSMLDHLRSALPTMLLEIIGDDNAVAISGLISDLEYRYFAIDEGAGRAIAVDRLWDNDHQNFLICRSEIAQNLAEQGLVELSR